MDEHGKPLETLGEATATTPKERFKRFALYHICYSFAFCAFLLLALFVYARLFVTSWAPQAPEPGQGDDISGLPWVMLAIACACVFPYFPLGMLAAKRGRWTVPSRRERLLAIAQPCAVSVSWVLLLLLLVATDNGELPGITLLNLYTILSCLFAAPSSLFSFFFFATTYFCEIIPGYFSFFVAPFLSALLPPLLFGLGSFWQSKRQKFSPPK